MARVPVANPYRKNGSPSTTSTAWSAKAAKKTAGATRAEWSPEDQDAAHLQGWGVFEIVDEKTCKVFFEIQLYGVRFDHDGYARLFVHNQSSAGDDLAVRALGVVFRSKAGKTARKK